MNSQYPHLAWLLTLKKNLQNPTNSENIENRLFHLIDQETNVIIRKILTGYLKNFLKMRKDESNFKSFDILMAIDNIQIQFTKESRTLSLIGIINQIQNGNFGFLKKSYSNNNIIFKRIKQSFLKA